MTESRCIHSQELLLPALLLVLLAMGILNSLPGLTHCHCDNIGLVSLILLGWELLLYHCTMCARHPDLVSLDFYAIPIFPLDIYTCIYSTHILDLLPILLHNLLYILPHSNAHSTAILLSINSQSTPCNSILLPFYYSTAHSTTCVREEGSRLGSRSRMEVGCRICIRMDCRKNMYTI